MTWELVEYKEDKNGLCGSSGTSFTGAAVEHIPQGTLAEQTLGPSTAISCAFPTGTTAHTEVRPPGRFSMFL